MRELRDKRCFREGCGGRAQWGFRFPGRMSEVPAGYRGYLWACSEHAGEAEARRDRAYREAVEAGVVVWRQGDLFSEVV